MAYRVSFADGIGIAGIILAVVCLVLDKAGKLKGGWLVGLLVLAGAMTLFLAIGNSWVLDAPQKWKIWRGVFMFSLVALTYSGLAIWITSGEMESKLIPPIPTPQDEKPPTLLNLFKSDFGNTLRVGDKNGPAFTVQAPDGSTVEILRQVYMDFPARTKFIGFYIPRSVPPPLDFKAEKTVEACFQLLKANAIHGSFDGIKKQVGVMGGQSGQMTTAKNLVFSGRVLIYHEEFLSIPQKAAIMNAYQKQNMDVQFYGDEYLGNQVIAWHQKHDK